MLNEQSLPMPDTAPTCSETCVTGTEQGLIVMIQTIEVIVQICGIGLSLIGKLMPVDTYNMVFQSVEIDKNPQCPICGNPPRIKKLQDYGEFCDVPHTGLPSTADTLPEITPHELSGMLKSSIPFRLVDVRHPIESLISKLPDAEIMSYKRLSKNMHRLDKDETIVIYCRTGVRSRRAQRMLLKVGFKHVKNLWGGINQYAKEVDPSLNIY